MKQASLAAAPPTAAPNMKDALQGRFRLPDSDTLQADLVSIGYKYQSDGRLLLESKQDMRRRGVPSPDEGNAVQGSPFPHNANFFRKLELPNYAYV